MLQDLIRKLCFDENGRCFEKVTEFIFKLHERIFSLRSAGALPKDTQWEGTTSECFSQ